MESFDQTPPPSPAKASSTALTDEPRAITRRHRILVVDDDDGIRYVSTAILQRAAFHVACAEDGEAGWCALQAEPFDLLITDHNMPRLTGLDLLRRVREAALRIPVILTSAGTSCNAPDLSLLLRPGLALAKPFSEAQLLGCVRRFLFPTAITDEKIAAPRHPASHA